MRAFLLMLLFFAKANAQQIGGTVKDSNGIAIPYATINVKNNEVIVAYTVTDSKGSYSLLVQGNQYLTIEARSLGYQTQVKSLPAGTEKVNFILNHAVNQLAAVEIKSTRPVLRTAGDTLSYKVADFSSPQDRVIGDVIKKIPGITVSADGTIRYNNKPVSGVHLGGDNLLDDKYNIATNTIPQHAVDEVQVIENHQPVKVLRNKVMSDDVALNLNFKKDAKLQVLGQETVGAGLPGKYYVDLNAMLFKDKYKAINYLKGNNTGTDIQQELVAHRYNEDAQRIDNDGAGKLLSLGTANDPALLKSRYLFNQSAILNLNNLVNMKNGAQFRINAYYLHDRQRQQYMQQTTVLLPGNTINYTELQQSRSQPDIWRCQLTMNINRDKYYLNNALTALYSKQASYAGLQTNNIGVNQLLNNRTSGFTNEFNLIRSLGSNHIIQGYSYINYSAGNESRQIGPDYQAAIFNDGVSYDQLTQQVNIPAFYTNNYLSYKIPFNLTTLSVRTGFSIQSQQLLSDLYGDVKLRMDSVLNQVHWRRNKLYAEPAFDINGQRLKANISLPVSLQQLNYTDVQYDFEKTHIRLLFNPQIRLKYQTNTEHFISLFYNLRNSTGVISDIYRGYILRDYLTLYANNSDITQAQHHVAGIGFNYRKAITMFFCSVNMVYNYTQLNNISSSIITDNMRKQVVLPYLNSNRTLTMSGTVSKYSFTLQTTFSGMVQWSKGYASQIQNDVLLPVSMTNTVYNTGIETKVNEHLNFSYQATCTQSRINADANKITQFLHQGAIHYNPYIDLQLKLSGEHYFTRRQGDQDLNYMFADASAKYTVKQWKVDFELSAVNFLNVKTYDARYLSANTIVFSSYTLPGRIVLLKAMFNI